MASLGIVIPCYNEEEVLPETIRRLTTLLDDLAAEGLIDTNSAAYFVDDGSRDRTWSLIEQQNRIDSRFHGFKLSRNQGHQNALLAGLLSADGDVLISIDADLQDDLGAIKTMMLAHRNEAADIVYGVRSKRSTDTFFKRLSAEFYYKLLKAFGVDVIFNHADFRLMSRPAIEALRGYREVNLFLRGIIPLLGFKTTIVPYDRDARFAGESKYPLRKMISLALKGITSFSPVPLRWITACGFIISLSAFGAGLWALLVKIFTPSLVPGWASTVIPMYFLGGIQLLSLGIIGEYLSNIYIETKQRPRYIIEKTV